MKITARGVTLLAIVVGGTVASACTAQTETVANTPPASGEALAASASTDTPSPAGEPVADTTVIVMRAARAGGTILVQAPPGSTVETDRASHTVAGSGRLELAAPGQAGVVHLRVTRPDGRALPFRVTVY
ncbi:hypothetical protein PQS31_00445 [Luteimonas sp BLCC-B24]|uniref:hypothetical protein n=1 Tax=Luteimonas sp. BLCC-B24 TaxID=3025317 RepID=UPI00234D1FCC|nr:hypothetical protein [Luteimonas sp. BLCC-B24]MDC7805298.1 hypothetical protein [Luteimonas sp. BLCC-B24]